MIINNIVRRKSKQREKIYDIIKNSKSHPTALWIYDELRKELPTVSMGNVYRNIKILTEDGSITCKGFSDGIEHYDAVTSLHYHFVCEKCNKVDDFTMPVQHGIVKKAQNNTQHIIKGHTIQFYGICKECNINK